MPCTATTHSCSRAISSVALLALTHTTVWGTPSYTTQSHLEMLRPLGPCVTSKLQSIVTSCSCAQEHDIPPPSTSPHSPSILSFLLSILFPFSSSPPPLPNPPSPSHLLLLPPPPPSSPLFPRMAQLDSSGWNDCRPLHRAAAEGNKNVLQLLLLRGANVNSTDNMG